MGPLLFALARKHDVGPKTDVKPRSSLLYLLGKDLLIVDRINTNIDILSRQLLSCRIADINLRQSLT